MRLSQDQAGGVKAMETASVRFVPTSGEGELVVDLVGAVHYGDRAYYQALNRAFRDYDVVLYELVAPEGSRVPRRDAGGAANPIQLFQKMSQAALGLESQLSGIDYTAKNFVHADLSPRQMWEAVAKRGETGLTLMLGVTADLLRQYNLEQARPAKPGVGKAAPEVDPFEELFKPGGTARLKRVIASELVRQAAPAAGLGKTIGTILIDDRNAAAMRVFQKELAKGRKRIAIFYGAAHMPDFERRLRLQFDMKRDSVRWFPAWDLRKQSGSAIGSLLKMLSKELSRELEPAARPARKPASAALPRRKADPVKGSKSKRRIF